MTVEQQADDSVGDVALDGMVPNRPSRRVIVLISLLAGLGTV